MKEWDPTLGNSALLIWDLQYGIAGKAFNLKHMLERIRLLKEAMHASGRPVLYSQTTGLPYESQSKFTQYRLRKRGIDPKSSAHMLECSHDWQLMEELPLDRTKDLLIKKFTPSLFVGTNAEQLLANNQVDSLVITGVSTENGVETTARHASCLGFVPVIVEDAVGSGDEAMHRASLEEMRKMFEVRSSADILETLKEHQLKVKTR